jgi:uncharacterized membrane protein YdfJ with MMPL/SSD domain
VGIPRHDPCWCAAGDHDPAPGPARHPREPVPGGALGFLGTEERGLWHRLATAIIRRPIIAGGVALAILLALIYPVTQLTFANGSLKNEPVLSGRQRSALDR